MNKISTAKAQYRTAVIGVVRWVIKRGAAYEQLLVEDTAGRTRGDQP